LRIPATSLAGELCAMALFGNTAAVTPKAESIEANCVANVLRVKFMSLLLKFFIDQRNS
jgi:hypothetical protein